MFQKMINYWLGMSRSSRVLFLPLYLIAAQLSAAQSVSTNAVTDAKYFGLHIHRADAGTAWPKVPFGVWRLWDAGVQWPLLEPARGRWDFSKLDRYVAMAQLTKVSILLPLGLSPRWASARPNERSAYGDGQAAEPQELEDWRAYVRAVAERYRGRVKEYEIWNEPNSKDFFSGTTESLVRLTCEAYRILKEADPMNLVVSPAYTGERNISKLSEFLAKGGNKCIDIASYHFYVPSSSPETMLLLIRRVREVMNDRGIGHFPLWNTESGWRMANDDGTPEKGVPDYWLRLRGKEAAAFVARALILARAEHVQRFYWYAWDNTTLGMVEPGSKAYKSAANAYGIVAEWLTGREAPRCVENSGMWTCTLPASSDGERRIAWHAKGGRATYSPPSDRVLISAERADGQQAKSLSAGAFEIDEVPVMIRLGSGQRVDQK
jgi:hypothetical protein